MATKGHNADSGSDSDESVTVHKDTISYVKDVSEIPFQEWLTKNRPSKINRNEGYKWLTVIRKVDHQVLDYKKKDIRNLCEAYGQLCDEKKIGQKDIMELATEHNIKGGKWLLFVDREEVDDTWSLIASAVIMENTPSHKAKVSTADTRDHVIAVYNHDCTDDDEIFSVEKSIRDLGFTKKLLYKLDACTYLGIYGSTKQSTGLCPTIMRSDFDQRKGKSSIKRYN